MTRLAKRQYHSGPYRRYFKDYAEKQVVEPDGRLRIERIYVGRYYMRKLSPRQRLLRKALYAVLYLAACALFLHAAVENAAVNRTWFVVVPSTLSLLSFFWLLVPVFFYMTAPKEMVVRTYKDSSGNLIRLSLITAILLSVTAAAAVVRALTAGGELSAFVAAGQYIAAGAILFCLCWLEKRQPYEVLPPTNRRPEKSVVI